MMPVLGLDDVDDPRYFAVAWKDRTVIAAILGDPAEWARAEQEAREAFEEEIRTLHENVVLLDDYRNRTDDHRETL
jgi:hypothetical protein